MAARLRHPSAGTQEQEALVGAHGSIHGQLDEDQDDMGGVAVAFAGGTYCGVGRGATSSQALIQRVLRG